MKKAIEVQKTIQGLMKLGLYKFGILAFGISTIAFLATGFWKTGIVFGGLTTWLIVRLRKILKK